MNLSQSDLYYMLKHFITSFKERRLIKKPLSIQIKTI